MGGFEVPSWNLNHGHQRASVRPRSTREFGTQALRLPGETPRRTIHGHQVDLEPVDSNKQLAP